MGSINEPLDASMFEYFNAEIMWPLCSLWLTT